MLERLRVGKIELFGVIFGTIVLGIGITIVHYKFVEAIVAANVDVATEEFKSAIKITSGIPPQHTHDVTSGGPVLVANVDGIRNIDQNFNFGEECYMVAGGKINAHGKLPGYIGLYLFEYVNPNQNEGIGPLCPNHTLFIRFIFTRLPAKLTVPLKVAGRFLSVDCVILINYDDK